MSSLALSYTRVYPLSMNHIIPADVVPAHLSQIHGHDYEVQVKVTPTKLLCEDWGFDYRRLDALVNELILCSLQGAMVNDHCSTGSSEHLCAEILRRLRQSPLGEAIAQVTLKETRKNSIECS